MNEEILTNGLISGIERDFEIIREVDGIHPIEGAEVRIDLMARARPHLIQSGFTNEWFGIECKWVAEVLGQTSKVTRLVWQSITYAQSSFLVNGEPVRPAFVAVYTPKNLDQSIERQLNELLSLGLYGNVGRIHFYQDGSWGIRFANIYARSEGGDFQIKHTQLPKRRIGSV